jgi:chromosomal replication initiation ATPase DnaA
MLKKEVQEIKVKLKNSGYDTSKADNFMYRVGFKTGYKIALQQSYTVEIMKELRQEKIQTENVINPNPKEVNIILQAVMDYTHIGKKELFSSSRPMHISIARSLCFILLRELLHISLPRIGYMVGNKDHTTVIHHLRSKYLQQGLWKPQHKIWMDYEELKNKLKKDLN